jgi:CheY-like chemotaxis protein
MMKMSCQKSIKSVKTVNLKALNHIRNNYTILLAEDNVVNQKIALKILSDYGFKTQAVANGFEAIGEVVKGIYDLILMDVQMPGMDGFATTIQIRNLDGKIGKIPIIALTAHAMHGNKEKCFAAGMNEYVTKPLSGEELIVKIDKLLNIDTPVEGTENISSTSEGDGVFDFVQNEYGKQGIPGGFVINFFRGCSSSIQKTGRMDSR